MEPTQNSQRRVSRQPPGKRPTPTEEIIQTSFRLPRSRWKRLQELSIEERASVQSIVVRALEAEFERRGLSF